MCACIDVASCSDVADKLSSVRRIVRICLMTAARSALPTKCAFAILRSSSSAEGGALSSTTSMVPLVMSTSFGGSRASSVWTSGMKLARASPSVATALSNVVQPRSSYGRALYSVSMAAAPSAQR